MVECEVVVEVECEAVIAVFGVVVDDGVIEVEVEVEVVMVDWGVVECEVVVEVGCEVVVVVFGVVGEDGVMEVKSYHEASGVVVLALVVRHVIQCKCIN